MKYQNVFCIALTACILLLSLTGCTPTFDGSSAKNADSYKLDVKVMNCTDSHSFELNQGDTLEILFEAESGTGSFARILRATTARLNVVTVKTATNSIPATAFIPVVT